MAFVEWSVEQRQLGVRLRPLGSNLYRRLACHPEERQSRDERSFVQSLEPEPALGIAHKILRFAQDDMLLLHVNASKLSPTT